MTQNNYSYYQSNIDRLQSQLAFYRSKMRQQDPNVDLSQLDAIEASAQKLMTGINGLVAESESDRKALSKMKVSCLLLGNEPEVIRAIFQNMKEKTGQSSPHMAPTAQKPVSIQTQTIHLGPEHELEDTKSPARPEDEKAEDDTDDDVDEALTIETRPMMTPSSSNQNQRVERRERRQTLDLMELFNQTTTTTSIHRVTEPTVRRRRDVQVQEQKPPAKPMGRRAAKLAALRRRGIGK